MVGRMEKMEGREDSERQENRKLNVLVVDDYPANLTLIGMILKCLDCVCEFAGNGMEALEKLNSDMSFDIVFMDCDMPVMDGATAIGEIRKAKMHERMKVFCISSIRADGRVSKRCVACAPDGILTKPIKMEKMEDVILKAREELGNKS